jgi:hypothetical protein
MAQTLSGGCACGAIRYYATADPIVMLNCHCRDCQQASGSAYAAIMVVPKMAVQLQGEPRYYRGTGSSGKAVDRGFCSQCGSPVTILMELMPDAFGLQAGSLDDPSQYMPAMDIFTASAQGWDHMDSTIKKFEHELAA